MAAVRTRGFFIWAILLALSPGLLAQGTAQLTVTGTPAIGSVIQLNLTDVPNRPFVLALSAANTPGIPVSPTLTVPLSWDNVFNVSLSTPGLFGLSTNTGVLGASGTGTVFWTIPNIASLVGVRLYAAFVTLDSATLGVLNVSNALSVTFVNPPAPPAPPTPTAPVWDPHLDLPGFNIQILQLTGGTGNFGNFLVGNTVTVRFRIVKNNGQLITIPDTDSVRIAISGPTFNYQRVITQQSDVRARAILQPDGSYLYTFVSPIPATYALPINDTPFYGPLDGDLGGQPLLFGTYSIGMEGYKNYNVEGSNVRDSSNAMFNFNIGTSTFVQKREVVRMENCQSCHENLMVHGRNRKDVTYCLMCHTSGSEDRNNAAIQGGTPGVSIDLKVMIHKIHNGKNLPSVLGVSTNPDGSRNYAATPTPYIIAAGSANDFSEIGFPVWPNLNIAMPRDAGYTALSATDKLLDDTIRLGATACDKCHGDPDGAGPIPAPAQGSFAYSKQSRRACGSCHDDVVWSHPYTANGQTMPAMFDDDSCIVCHSPTGGSPLSPIDGHVHPLNNPAVNAGFNVDILSVTEAGANNGNGKIDPGEKVAVSFTLKNDAGVDVPASIAGASLSLVVSGPTHNRQLLLNTSIPTAGVGAGPVYNVVLPEPIVLDFVGTSTGALDTFNTSRTAVWNVTGAVPSLLVRTAAGISTTLAAPGLLNQNWIDVVDATGFVRNDYIVLDDGIPGAKEYMRIQTVQGNRLWFSSSNSGGYKGALATQHFAGALVTKVTLSTKTIGTQFTVNAAGLVTEVAEFGAGNDVLLSYTSDYVLPFAYGLTLNDTPDLGEESGKWTGKPMESGTYAVGIWGAPTINLALQGETNSYRGTSPAEIFNFLVGSATTVQPASIVSSGATCNECHDDLYFHGGGRRGFDTCILCHGVAGGEDRPQYVAANAPATTGVQVDFREMLHKIHMGKELTNAASYLVNGFGSGAYPNNFTSYMYDEIGFPSMPGGPMDCKKCHGTSLSWQAPGERDHTTAQGVPVQEWRTACASCHDSALALTHFQSNTTPAGVESCALCHGQGQTWSLDFVHKIR